MSEEKNTQSKHLTLQFLPPFPPFVLLAIRSLIVTPSVDLILKGCLCRQYFLVSLNTVPSKCLYTMRTSPFPHLQGIRSLFLRLRDLHLKRSLEQVPRS